MALVRTHSRLNNRYSWLLVNELNKLPEGLRGRADELRAAISVGEIKQLYIWYVHNLLVLHQCEERAEVVAATAAKAALKQLAGGQDVNIFAEEICEKQLDRLYMQAERTVIVTDTIKTIVPDAIEVKEKDWTSLADNCSGLMASRSLSQVLQSTFFGEPARLSRFARE